MSLPNPLAVGILYISILLTSKSYAHTVVELTIMKLRILAIAVVLTFKTRREI